MKTRTCLLIGLLIGCATTALAAPADAVAMILAETRDGTSNLGSGFFIAADGRLITCYHVIAGASKIRIITADSWTDEVIVQAIAPSRDLAMLRVTGMRAPVSVIPLGLDARPGEFANAPLDVYGYATSLLSEGFHRLARTTSATYLKSAALRHPGTRQPLFSLQDVDLIPLDVTVSTGLSGSPVIFNGAAVGVMSGSRHAGGSMTWAIPVKYSTDLSPLDQPPGQIDTWPPLTLMSPGWTSPGGGAALGAGLGAALDRFGHFIETSAALEERAMNELTRLGNEAIERYRKAADLAVFRLGSRYRLDELSPDSEAVFLKALGAYATRADYYDGEFDALDPKDAVGDLTKEVGLYFARLPQSAGNTARRDEALAQIDDAFRRANPVDVQLASRMAVFGAIADSYNTVDTLGDVKRDIEQAADTFRTLLQETGDVNTASSRLRVATTVIESLFRAQ